jgi:spermidine dehydrogenase
MSESDDHSRARDDGITRRDFLDGVAITAAGLAAAAAAPHLTGAEAAEAARRGLPRSYYPPTDTGLKGQRDDVVSRTIQIDGLPNPDDVHSTEGGPGIDPRKVKDTGESYDCVIVGAGASGLAAAKFYRDRFGEDSSILLLDALPDFGGHSARNEFHIRDATTRRRVLILRNGGTVNLDSIGTWNQPAGALFDIPGSYGQPALDLLEFCGVDPHDFPNEEGPGIPSEFGLRPMLLFPSEDWGVDTLIRNRQSSQPWPEFLATTPFSPEAQAGIARIQTDTTSDWITLRDGPKTVAEKQAILAAITQKQYYMDYVGVPEESTLWYQRNGHSLLGAGVQAISAADAWALGRPASMGSASRSRASRGSGALPSSASSIQSTRRSHGPTATPPCCGCCSTG